MSAAIKTRAIWFGLALAFSAPLLAWLGTVNDPMSYVRLEGLPPGQQFYLIAKLAGLIAFCLFWLQCMLALARYLPVVSEFPVADMHLHKRLGFATALLIVLHAGLFILAASLRTGHASWDLLLPNFTHGYYRLNVGLGAIAFWIVCLTVFAGWRTARGHRGWKVVHLLWPLVFGLAFVHAFAIGTESRFGAMRYLVLFTVATLTMAAIARVVRARRQAPRSAPDAIV